MSFIALRFLSPCLTPETGQDFDPVFDAMVNTFDILASEFDVSGDSVELSNGVVVTPEPIYEKTDWNGRLCDLVQSAQSIAQEGGLDEDVIIGGLLRADGWIIVGGVIYSPAWLSPSGFGSFEDVGELVGCDFRKVVEHYAHSKVSDR